MSTQQSTIDFLTDQIAHAGIVASRKMFGEYALYCDGKVVGLVCDDELFIKPTEKGKAYIKARVERPPYPGAKPYFWISGDLWDDHIWLTELVRITAEALPFPKKKVRKKEV